MAELEAEKPKRRVHPRETDDIVREQVGGFLRFMHEYAVVGLAIGFIIGQQAQFVVKQLVDSFVTPLLNVFIGQSLQSKAFTITFSDNHASVTWGKFVYVLMNFVFVLIFIYLLVKMFKLDKIVLKKKK